MNEHSWNEMERQLNTLENSGRKTVPISSLLQYVNEIREIESEVNASTTTDLAKRWEATLAEYDARQRASLEFYRASTQAGTFALKTATIINGGASVAILAFLGSMGSMGSPMVSEQVAGASLMIFLSGVFLSALAIGATYLSSFANSRRSVKWFWVANSFAMLFAAVSYLAFLAGGIVMCVGFLT